MGKKEIYQMLLNGSDAADVIDDWWETSQSADVTIRRAKTKGCCVIETADVLFARRIQLYHPACKIHIKTIKIMRYERTRIQN